MKGGVVEFESKLVPVLREGVSLVKMILFKKLKPYISEKYSDRDSAFVGMLSGAMVNDLFGTPNTDEPFGSFYDKNSHLIETELNTLSTEFEDLKIPLTDALRIQFLCDSQEGIDSEFILKQARQLNILIIDREVPLPNSFTTLVKQLGVAYGMLIPQEEDKGGANDDGRYAE